MNNKKDINIQDGLVCPIPKSEYEKVVMAHGGGGTLSNQLIQKMFLTQFDNEMLQQEHDGAIFKIGNLRFAFSTDSYVVNPIFFPGIIIRYCSAAGFACGNILPGFKLNFFEAE